MIRYGIPLVFLFLIIVYGAIAIRSRLIALDSYNLVHDGTTRAYRLSLPDDMDDTQAYPLAILLHGVGGTGQGLADYVAFHESATDWVVAYPDGIEGNWNDGRAEIQSEFNGNAPDDVAFLTVLIDDLSTTYAINREQVYVIGLSNGGIMSMQMGCDQSDLITGIGVVTANFPVDMTCEPTSPLQVVIINGTEDPLYPYDGGDISEDRGTIISTDDTVAFWVEHNNCADSTTSTIDENETDNTSLEYTSYSGCDAGGSVEFYSVVGGGHTWVGGNQYAPPSLIGATSREGNAADILLQHFGE